MSEWLLVSAGTFALVKLAFGFLSWFASDEGDSFIRRRLDVVWDELERRPLRQSVSAILRRLVRKVAGVWSVSPLKIVLVLYVVNYVGALVAVPALHLHGWELERYFWLQKMIGGPSQAVSLLAISGTFFGLLSLVVTWSLLRSAAATPSTLKLNLHLVADVVLAVLSVAWAMIVNGFITAGYAPDAPWGIFNEFWNARLWIRLGRFFPELFSFVALGAVAAIPTLAYSLVLTAATAAHLSPKWVHRFVHRSVWLVTTDSTPVLARMGTVLGGISAGLVALGRLLS